MQIALDTLDRAILGILRRDARTSIAAIAQEVNVSRANAYARVKRMTDGGVILGYGVRTDPVLEGHHASAYVALSVDQSQWQEIRRRLVDLPEVEHVALVGGEFDVMVLVRARDNRDLRRVILEQVQGVPGVKSSRTSLIFEDIDAHSIREPNTSTPEAQ